MIERGGYPPGVPCWVACVSPDPEKAVAFYTELFGWEAESLMPPGSSGSYFLCTLRGRPVAAVVSFHGAPPPPGAVWTTFICVESADDTSSEVTAADGSVIGVPGRLAGGGRMAVVADPAGAVFGLWQPGRQAGAGWSTSRVRGA